MASASRLFTLLSTIITVWATIGSTRMRPDDGVDVWSMSHYSDTESCSEYVARNPDAFREAFFEIKDIRYFQDTPLANSRTLTPSVLSYVSSKPPEVDSDTKMAESSTLSLKSTASLGPVVATITEKRAGSPVPMNPPIAPWPATSSSVSSKMYHSTHSLMALGDESRPTKLGHLAPTLAEPNIHLPRYDTLGPRDLLAGLFNWNAYNPGAKAKEEKAVSKPTSLSSSTTLSAHTTTSSASATDDLHTARHADPDPRFHGAPIAAKWAQQETEAKPVEETHTAEASSTKTKSKSRKKRKKKTKPNTSQHNITSAATPNPGAGNFSSSVGPFSSGSSEPQSSTSGAQPKLTTPDAPFPKDPPAKSESSERLGPPVPETRTAPDVTLTSVEPLTSGSSTVSISGSSRSSLSVPSHTKTFAGSQPTTFTSTHQPHTDTSEFSSIGLFTVSSSNDWKYPQRHQLTAVGFNASKASHFWIYYRLKLRVLPAVSVPSFTKTFAGSHPTTSISIHQPRTDTSRFLPIGSFTASSSNDWKYPNATASRQSDPTLISVNSSTSGYSTVWSSGDSRPSLSVPSHTKTLASPQHPAISLSTHQPRTDTLKFSSSPTTSPDTSFSHVRAEPKTIKGGPIQTPPHTGHTGDVLDGLEPHSFDFRSTLTHETLQSSATAIVSVPTVPVTAEHLTPASSGVTANSIQSVPQTAASPALHSFLATTAAVDRLPVQPPSQPVKVIGTTELVSMASSPAVVSSPVPAAVDRLPVQPPSQPIKVIGTTEHVPIASSPAVVSGPVPAAPGVAKDSPGRPPSRPDSVKDRHDTSPIKAGSRFGGSPASSVVVDFQAGEGSGAGDTIDTPESGPSGSKSAFDSTTDSLVAVKGVPVQHSVHTGKALNSSRIAATSPEPAVIQLPTTPVEVKNMSGWPPRRLDMTLDAHGSPKASAGPCLNRLCATPMTGEDMSGRPPPHASNGSSALDEPADTSLSVLNLPSLTPSSHGRPTSWHHQPVISGRPPPHASNGNSALDKPADTSSVLNLPSLTPLSHSKPTSWHHQPVISGRLPLASNEASNGSNTSYRPVDTSLGFKLLSSTPSVTEHLSSGPASHHRQPVISGPPPHASNGSNTSDDSADTSLSGFKLLASTPSVTGPSSDGPASRHHQPAVSSRPRTELSHATAVKIPIDKTDLTSTELADFSSPSSLLMTSSPRPSSNAPAIVDQPQVGAEPGSHGCVGDDCLPLAISSNATRVTFGAWVFVSLLVALLF